MDLLDTTFLSKDELLVYKLVEKWHAPQRRRVTNLPYVVHLLGVARQVKLISGNTAMVMAALCHDLFEDTNCTEEELYQILNETSLQPKERKDMVKWVWELTDVYTKASYPEMNRRQRKKQENLRLEKVSAEAQTIKYADLIDNTLDLQLNDPDFSGVYVEETYEMLSLIRKGDFGLYTKAVSINFQAREQNQKQSPRGLVKAYLSALGNGDLPGLLHLFSKEAQVHSPRYGVKPAKAFFIGLLEETQTSTLNLYNTFLSSDGNICAYFHYEWLLKNGDTIKFDVCDVFKVADGKFQELRIVYDPS